MKLNTSGSVNCHNAVPTEQECWDKFWLALAQGIANSLIRRSANQAFEDYISQRSATSARSLERD